jgi:hypothetical protein
VTGVLFLAVGGSRRRETIAESARVVAAGGRAVILVDRVDDGWRPDQLAAGVEVVELAGLLGRHAPWRAQEAVLFGAPRALLRAAGRGRLRRFAERAGAAYERRLAWRVHRRVFLPAYERIWARTRQSMVERRLFSGAAYDVLVVHDPMSMPLAVQLITGDAFAGRAPAVRFDLDPADLSGDRSSAAGAPRGGGR